MAEQSVYLKGVFCSSKRHQQKATFKTSNLSAIGLVVKALKLPVAPILKMQNYLDTNDCLHTISFEFESLSQFLFDC